MSFQQRQCFAAVFAANAMQRQTASSLPVTTTINQSLFIADTRPIVKHEHWTTKRETTQLQKGREKNYKQCDR